MQKKLRRPLIILGSLIVAYLLLLLLVPEWMIGGLRIGGVDIYFFDFAVLVPDWLLLLIVTAVVVVLIIQRIKRKRTEHPF